MKTHLRKITSIFCGLVLSAFAVASAGPTAQAGPAVKAALEKNRAQDRYYRELQKLRKAGKPVTREVRQRLKKEIIQPAQNKVAKAVVQRMNEKLDPKGRAKRSEGASESDSGRGPAATVHGSGTQPSGASYGPKKKKGVKIDGSGLKDLIDF